MSHRVLVTGANGYIGRHVLPLLLERGYEVHAVSRSTPARDIETAVSWHALDALDPLAGARLLDELRPERLLHLAWYTEHGRYWESLENIAWVGATCELVRAFAEAGGSRAVCAGTCAEYLWDESVCVEQQTAIAPATMYGIAKDAAHRVLAGLAARGSLELAWARPFLLYGEAEDPRRLVPYVTAALLEGRPADVTDGTATRDFLHVRDVALALVTILDSDLTGPVNVASGSGVSLREVLELVGAAAGASELLRFGAIPARAGEPARLLADTSRLRAAGFVPTTALEDGIAETVRWWRERLAVDRP